MRFLAATATAAYALGVTNGDAILESTYKGKQGLNDFAKAAGKYMGTASDLNPTDSFYTAALENSADWGMLTPGNAMKWDSTEYSQNSFQFAKGEAIVAEVKKISGAKLRCHTLCWHSQTPTWVQGLSKAEMLKALENHITKVMTHFGDSCHHWDVLNEALNEDGTYRQSFWYKTTGTDYIETAFKTAAAVKANLSLSTKLYYNDYNTDHVNAKSTGVLTNIVKFLQGKNIEIDGVGFQAHLTAGQVASKADQIANMKRFTDLKLEVAITELDVKVGSSSPTTAQQKQQATDYQNTIAACKDLKGCVGVTVWDFPDQYSWITSDAPLPMHQPGGRGTKVVRKAAYDSIILGWGGSLTGTSTAATTAPEADADDDTPATTPATTTKAPAATKVTPATPTTPKATTAAPAATKATPATPAATKTTPAATKAASKCKSTRR